MVSERPRDRYGRPLPDGDLRGYPGVPPRDVISAVQAWQDALRYIAEDLPFHAHETFEQRWRCCPEAERDAWRACAQWGAALTHRARGNAVGASALAERARSTLLGTPVVPEAIDVERILRSLGEISP